MKNTILSNHYSGNTFFIMVILRIELLVVLILDMNRAKNFEYINGKFVTKKKTFMCNTLKAVTRHHIQILFCNKSFYRQDIHI